MYRSPNKCSLQSLLIKEKIFMKLIPNLTILNRKFNEMAFIRDAMNSRKLATERLHDDYRKMFKNKQTQIMINDYF